MLRSILLRTARLYHPYLYTDLNKRPTLPYFYDVNISLFSKYPTLHIV